MEPETRSTTTMRAVRAAALGESDVATVFQPIVSLDDEEVVGFEALSRWPGVPRASAESVFQAAKARGVAGDLDRRCVRAAVNAALAARLPRHTMLLINTEPTTVAPVAADDASVIDVNDRHRLVFELTERELLTHPRALLVKLAWLREAGVGIALDDVGGDVDVMAWLGVIDPDIVKLDLSLIQHRPAPEQARILNAVYGFHERTGALILAEGIETEAHLDQARAVGATLGQGYRFGHPTPSGVHPTAAVGVAPVLSRRVAPSRVASDTPFEAVTRCGVPARTAGLDVLDALSRDVEAYAEHAPDRPMVLAAVPHGLPLPNLALHRLQRVTQSCCLVAVFGHDLPTELDSGVIRVQSDVGDPLGAEWALVVLGNHSAFAIVARQNVDVTHPAGPLNDADRRFAFVVTSDRSVITSAATSLLARIP